MSAKGPYQRFKLFRLRACTPFINFFFQSSCNNIRMDDFPRVSFFIRLIIVLLTMSGLVLRYSSRTSGSDEFTAWPYARFVSLAEGSRG